MYSRLLFEAPHVDNYTCMGHMCRQPKSLYPSYKYAYDDTTMISQDIVMMMYTGLHISTTQGPTFKFMIGPYKMMYCGIFIDVVHEHQPNDWHQTFIAVTYYCTFIAT
jgi:hypothetical protein